MDLNPLPACGDKGNMRTLSPLAGRGQGEGHKLDSQMRGENFNQTFRARELRGNATPAEKLLWKRMSNRQIGGYKFVRQEPIGRYFVDFVCREKHLVIEIDGATHSTESERAYDAQRTDFLQTQGYSVLRFLNDEVFKNIEGVLETILNALLSTPLTPLSTPLTPTLSPPAGRGSAYEINPLTLGGEWEPNGLGDNHGSH